MNIPNPDGTRKPCPKCEQPTVLAVTDIGRERVHCGTFDARCYTRPGGAR